MKKILLIILCILLVSCSKEINIQNTVTENNNDGKIYWGFVEDTLYISSCESDNAKQSFSIDYAPKTYDDVPWMKFEKEIKKVIITDGEKKVKPKSMAFWFSLGKLESITGLNNLDTSEVVDMQSLFEASGLEDIDLSTFNTSNVTDMSKMFSNSKVTELNISGFDTSQVINMNSMFNYCTNIKKIDLSSFNTSNVREMSFMFNKCKQLTDLNLDNFNTSNVTDLCFMFCNCESIKTLDLSGFDTKNVTDMSEMFGSCYSLEKIDISSFDTSNVVLMEGMFCNPNNYIKNIDISFFDYSSEEYILDNGEDCILDYMFADIIPYQ